MNAMSDPRKNYATAFLLGAVSGGLLVALDTRIIPKTMSQIMSGMMQNMISQMSENGCDPSEM